MINPFKKIHVPTFLLLWILSVISSLLVLPYTLSTQAETLEKMAINIPLLIVISIIQSVIIFSIVIYLGLLLRNYISLPPLKITEWLKNKTISLNAKKDLLYPSILGASGGILIIFIDYLFSPYTPQLSLKQVSSVFFGFLASFYGAIVEEVIIRLFLMSLLIFIGTKLVSKKHEIKINWAAIIIATAVFGLAHLPVTQQLVGVLTPVIIFRALILNGVLGIIFGYLYVKKGLFHAIIAHFICDIVLHVLFPLSFLFLG